MLKPTWWNKLVWEGCHSLLAFNGTRNAVEFPAVQDPLFLFSMTLQLCGKNAAYEGERPFSFRTTSVMRMM